MVNREQYFPIRDMEGLSLGAISTSGRLRIAVRRDNRIAYVTCLHTIVNYDGRTGKIKSTGKLVGDLISEEEHFWALCSYVEVLAETGIVELFRKYWEVRATVSGEQDLPVGFNAEMQSQLLQALKVVSPNALHGIKYFIAERMVQDQDAEWLAKRKILLQSSFGFVDILRNEAFTANQPPAFQQKVAEILNPLLGLDQKKCIRCIYLTKTGCEQLIEPRGKFLSVPIYQRKSLKRGQRMENYSSKAFDKVVNDRRHFKIHRYLFQECPFPNYWREGA